MTTLTDRLQELYERGRPDLGPALSCDRTPETRKAARRFKSLIIQHRTWPDIADEITRLTSEVERLEKSQQHWRAECNNAEGSWELCREKANAEITTLRETLAWYGDEGNWNKACVDDGTAGYTWTRPIIADKGQRARDALQKGEQQ